MEKSSASGSAKAISTVFSDAAALLTELTELCGSEQACTALVDVSRYDSVEAWATTVGVDERASAAMPNLYGNFSPALKSQGPRCFSTPLSDPRWAAICGEALANQAASFIVHDANTRGLQDHLKRLIKLQQPDGSNLLFRFQDTIVLSTLAPLLTPAQRRTLLGPAAHWLVLDVCGRPEHIARTPYGGLHPSSLVLNGQQIQALDVGLWPGSIIQQANDTDQTLLNGQSRCQQWHVVRSAVSRAQARGLRTLEDVALFSVLSLQLPDDFDSEGPVARALQRSQAENISFGDAIDQVPAQEWRDWQDVIDPENIVQASFP